MRGVERLGRLMTLGQQLAEEESRRLRLFGSGRPT